MSTYITALRRTLGRLWRDSAPLTAVCLLMLADILICAAGLALDPRRISGFPAWLKPLKFGISTAIYTGTFAWLFHYIRVWPRMVRGAGWVTAATLVVEIVLIDVQAARGITSHFNVTTPMDSLIFSIMGAAIAMLWIAGVCIALAAFRQQFADQAWGWSLRLGLAITLVGAATAGLMLAPTAQQMEALKQRSNPGAVGSHTVGSPDGGRGLPGVGWSMDRGDLRVPHFFGLHAVQVLPLLVWILRRRRNRTELAFTAAGSYLALIGILLWQALRGQSIIHPDQLTGGALLVWLALSTLAFSAWGRRAPTRAVAA